MSTRRLTLLHPVLFAAYAVLFLYAENVRILELRDVLPSLLVAVAIGACAIALSRAVLHDWAGAAMLGSSVVLLFFFAYAPLKVATDTLHAPPSLEGIVRGALPGVLFLVVGGAAVIGSLALTRSPRVSVPAVNSALTVGALVLLAFPLVTLATTRSDGRSRYTGGPSQLVASRAPDRDIYYLILDRYGTNEALAEAFNVDENDLPAWLAQNGFYVASSARANYDRTALSIPATLSLDYLDSIVQAMDPSSDDYEPVFDMIQDHRVGRFLKEQGYEYLHLGNWYGPTSRVSIADENLRAPTLSEFEAKLVDVSAIEAIAGLVTISAPVPAAEQLQFETARYQFAKLDELAEQPSHRFVFAHILLPHDPYVFQSDGTYFASLERGESSEDERFEEQLKYTNSAVRTLVSLLLARPERERPIIVIQADEGPKPLRYREQEAQFDWTMATAAEVRAKFGILDAFYLPTERNAPEPLPEPYPTISSVNTFRLVFDRYFGTGLGLLSDRSFAARHPELPYDMVEVTSRLAH